MKSKKPPLRISTLLFALYMVMSPLDMILNIFGTGTILKFIGILIIFTLIIEYMLSRSRLKFNLGIILTIIYCAIYLLTSIFSKYVQIFPSSVINLGLFFILIVLKDFSLREYKFLLKSTILGAVFFSIYMIINIESMLFFQRVTIVIGGHFVDPNDMGANLLLPFFLCIEYIRLNRNKIVMFICITSMLIITYAILLTGSRGTLVALALGLLTYFILNFKKYGVKVLLFAPIFTLFIITFYFSIEDFLPEVVRTRLSIDALMADKGSGRLIIWDNALAIFKNSDLFRLFFGYGFGNFPYLHSDYYGIYVGSHNLFIQNLLEVGLVGFLLLLSILFVIANKAFRKGHIVLLGMLIATLIISGSLETINKKFFWNALIFVSMQIVSKSPNSNRE